MSIETISITFFFFFALNAQSQKYLIIERAGSKATEKIAQYDELTFQLKDDDKGWYTRQIFDLNADAQLVQMGDTWIHVSDITRIFLKRKRTLASVAGGALQAGGISMFLGDAFYTIRGSEEYTEGGMEFGIINLIAGTAIRKLLEPIRYRINKKTRLRVIDITYRSQ